MTKILSTHGITKILSTHGPTLDFRSALAHKMIRKFERSKAEENYYHKRVESQGEWITPKTHLRFWKEFGPNRALVCPLYCSQ